MEKNNWLEKYKGKLAVLSSNTDYQEIQFTCDESIFQNQFQMLFV